MRSTIGGRSGEAISIWKRLIRENPEDGEMGQYKISLITSLLKASTNSARQGGKTDYPTVVRHCDEFLAQHSKSHYLPTVINCKWKALKENGELGRALEFLKSQRTVIAQGAKGKSDSAASQEDFLRVHEQFGFHVGFCAYASGRASEAEAEWQSYLENDLAELERMGQLSQAGTVYKNRTKKLMQTLETLQGKPAQELETLGWIGDKTTLEKERGNVVALFFTPHQQRRSEAFARSLQEFYKGHWHEGFRAILVCFPKGKQAGQGQAMQAWMQQLNLTYPGCLDTNERATHRNFNASVGSGTVVVLDRQGCVAWYKMDPTERDLELAAHVYQRLLKAPK